MVHTPMTATLHSFASAVELFAALHQHIDSTTARASLVCMPTGSTPLPLYAAMRASESSRALWSTFRYLQLDEYLNAPLGTELFREYLQRELFDPLQVPAAQRFTIDENEIGRCEEQAAQMDATLSRQGPLQLAVLGLGHNGHIAFNEPAPEFADSYHKVELRAATLRNNFGELSSAESVEQKEAQKAMTRHHDTQGDVVSALTISVPQILTAEQICLVVPQQDKQEVLDRALKGPVTAQLPATALIEHPNLHVFRVRS